MIYVGLLLIIVGTAISTYCATKYHQLGIVAWGCGVAVATLLCGMGGFIVGLQTA